MMNIQTISVLSCSLTAILVVLIPLAVFASGTDDSIKPIRPQVQRSGIPDDSIKPTSPQVQRSGTSDDAVKPIAPRFQRSGTNDDGIKPVFPKLQRLSPPNQIVKPVAPKQLLPAKKTKTGQTDESI
jgi:hypothetical protein